MKDNCKMGTKIKASELCSKRGVIAKRGSKASRKFPGKKRKTRTWQQRDENTQCVNGVAWKAGNILKPHPLHPKPPWKDKKNKDESLGIDSGVTMEWES